VLSANHSALRVDTVEAPWVVRPCEAFDFPAKPRHKVAVPPMGGAGARKVRWSSPHLPPAGFRASWGYRLFVDDLLPAPGAGVLQLER